MTGIRERFRNLNGRELVRTVFRCVLFSLPYVLIGYLGDKAAFIWRMTDGKDISEKTMHFLGALGSMFSDPAPSLESKDLLAGVCCGVLLRIAVYFKARNARKFRNGEEYGSARWSA